MAASSGRMAHRQLRQPSSAGSWRCPAPPAPVAVVHAHAGSSSQRTRRCVATRAGPLDSLPEGVRNFFDFSSWAPRSSRIWRLQQYPGPGSDEAAEASASEASPGAPDSMSVLSERISQMRDSHGAGSRSGSSSSSSGGGSVLLDPPSSSSEAGAEEGEAVRSFSDADDGELSAALGRRVSQIASIASTSGDWSDSMDEEEMRQPLTGEEMRQLLLKKYGKQYDVSFVKRDMGVKTFVSLNIMWLHLEQASFRMTPAQYAEKLDSAAQLVNVLGQTDKVRAFLRAPARSQKGLPRRPVVGTAISIQFDLEPSVIAEWFGSGYD